MIPDLFDIILKTILIVAGLMFLCLMLVVCIVVIRVALDEWRRTKWKS